jgi:hypothetical protein
VFVFLSADFLPETKVLVVGVDDAFHLGVLSARAHTTFATSAGGWLGVGNDSTYNHSDCFDPYPFPAATPDQQSRIRDLAEQLDAHRKRQQAAHPELTLTGLYNVLEKLKAGEALSAKDKSIYEQGLVSVLKSLHDELDRAVLAAYGWDDLAPLLEVANGNARPESAGHTGRMDALRALDAALLERLVALNAERAAEEARGRVRWLRPDFQARGATPTQTEIATPEAGATPSAALPGASKQSWPTSLPEQIALVANLLAAASAPLTADAIAARYTGRGPWKKRLPQLLETLVALGRARAGPQGYTAAT